MSNVSWDWTAARRVVIREARRLLRDPEDVEDVAQEALARAWRSRPVQQPDAWLRTVARNEALRLLARRRDIPVDDVAESPVADDHAAVIERLVLHAALDDLSADDRRLLAMRYDEDRTQADIARRLGLPPGTVAIRLSRLRARMRHLLETSA